MRRDLSSGRSVLSPAYRDRWRAHRFIPRPGEAEYRAMLDFLVFGQQPEVTVLGRTYPGARQAAPLAALAAWPDVRTLLPALELSPLRVVRAWRAELISNPLNQTGFVVTERRQPA